MIVSRVSIYSHAWITSLCKLPNFAKLIFDFNSLCTHALVLWIHNAQKCENSKTVLKQIKIFRLFLLTLWDVKHTATTKATVERIIVSLKVVLSQMMPCYEMITDLYYGVFICMHQSMTWFDYGYLSWYKRLPIVRISHFQTRTGTK